MTKKQINTFMRIIQMNNIKKYPSLCGIIKLEDDNFYYASNPYMILRSTESPADVFVPEEAHNGWMYTKIQDHFTNAILHNNKAVELPSKKNLVEYRSMMTAGEKRKKPIPLYAESGDIIYVNNSYLNLLLDVFDDGEAFMGNPLEPLYLINKTETIEGILLPIRVIRKDVIA